MVSSSPCQFHCHHEVRIIKCVFVNISLLTIVKIAKSRKSLIISKYYNDLLCFLIFHNSKLVMVLKFLHGLVVPEMILTISGTIYLIILKLGQNGMLQLFGHSILLSSPNKFSLILTGTNRSYQSDNTVFTNTHTISHSSHKKLTFQFRLDAKRQRIMTEAKITFLLSQMSLLEQTQILLLEKKNSSPNCPLSR